VEKVEILQIKNDKIYKKETIIVLATDLKCEFKDVKTINNIDEIIKVLLKLFREV
jgi:hypothetical protein